MRYHIDTDKVVWRNLSGEAIILNLETGHYYSLNKTGTLIWSLLCENKDSEEIIDRVVGKYRISKEKAKEDMEALVALLENVNLLLPKKPVHNE